MSVPISHAWHIDLQAPLAVTEFSYFEKEVSFNFWSLNMAYVHAWV